MTRSPRSSPTARRPASSAATSTPTFASMAFYGAVEQLLSGWIFEVIPAADSDFDEAKTLLVTTICDGLEPR